MSDFPLFSILCLAFLIVCRTTSVGNDLNCTVLENGEHVYSPSAVSCSNILSDESCRLIFPSSSRFPAPGSNSPRPSNCYRNLNTLSSNVIQKRAKGIALAFCPKTCGFCCQTDEVRLKLELGEFL